MPVPLVLFIVAIVAGLVLYGLVVLTDVHGAAKETKRYFQRANDDER